MQNAEKKQRRRTWFWVGVPGVLLVYLLVVPIFLIWYVQDRMGRQPNRAVEVVLEMVVKPATWSAARVRPYYAYWRFVGREVVHVPVLPWDEMQKKRERNKWLR